MEETKTPTSNSNEQMQSVKQKTYIFYLPFNYLPLRY